VPGPRTWAHRDYYPFLLFRNANPRAMTNHTAEMLRIKPFYFPAKANPDNLPGTPPRNRLRTLLSGSNEPQFRSPHWVAFHRYFRTVHFQSSLHLTITAMQE
jgi:hypothetical protein